MTKVLAFVTVVLNANIDGRRQHYTVADYLDLQQSSPPTPRPPNPAPSLTDPHPRHHLLIINPR